MEWIGKIFKFQTELPPAPAQRVKRKLVKRVVTPEARERDQLFKRLSQMPKVRKSQIQWE